MPVSPPRDLKSNSPSLSSEDEYSDLGEFLLDAVDWL
jgi:hypothetical protein